MDEVLDLLHSEEAEDGMEEDLEVDDPHEALWEGSDEEYDELEELENGTETTVEA